jgi:hypothetical protein
VLVSAIATWVYHLKYVIICDVLVIPYFVRRHYCIIFLSMKCIVVYIFVVDHDEAILVSDTRRNEVILNAIETITWNSSRV